MCCLPNRFPLPIFLLINKYDEILNDKSKEKDLQYAKKDKIESYALANQFFNTFLIVKNSEDENINNKNIDINDTEKTDIINDQSTNNKEPKFKESGVEAEVPFQEIIKVITGFRDIRNAFISQGGGVIDNTDVDGLNTKENKKCIIY